jgi:hypothetical protein
LRGATAAAARDSGFLSRSGRAENRKLLLNGTTLTFRAGDLFPRGENNRFEAVLTFAATVFEYRHYFYSGKGQSQAPF